MVDGRVSQGRNVLRIRTRETPNKGLVEGPTPEGLVN